MSQTHDCPCHDDITMIPIHGLQIGIQSDLLKKCDCDGSGGGRTRVTEDLRIYIDGKRTESGNGLTPETAVASYEDAVDVASRYDGCNKWNVYFHFADLAAGEMYPIIVVAGVDHATFASAHVYGESYLTTKFTKLFFTNHSTVNVSEIYTLGVSVINSSYVLVSGKISLQGYSSQTSDYGLAVTSMGYCAIGSGAEIYIQGGNYHAVFVANSSGKLDIGGKIIVVKATTVSWVFAGVQYGYLWAGSATISSQATVTGARYAALFNGFLNTNGKGTSFFPGTVAGTAASGGIYI